MELFAKTINGFEVLTFFTKTCILEVWLGSKCVNLGKSANMSTLGLTFRKSQHRRGEVVKQQ